MSAPPVSAESGPPKPEIRPAGRSLSVSLVTCNEEANLARCLESVHGLADEIVIVDSGSTDGTRTIAESFGAVWIERPWPGFREQKNVSLDACTREWVLCLDADEALSSELRAEIERFLGEAADGDDVAGAEFPRRSWFLGRWIRHGDWYPDRVLRLVRRGRGHWAGTKAHTAIQLEGACRRLPGDLLHWPFPTMRRFVEKQLSYAEAYASEGPPPASGLKCFLRAAWRGFRGYVLKLGFLDGFAGLWIAVGNAYATFLKYSLTRDRNPPPR